MLRVIEINYIFTTDTGALLLAGFAPTINISGGDVTVNIGIGELILIGFEPAVDTSTPPTPPTPSGGGGSSGGGYSRHHDYNYDYEAD